MSVALPDNLANGKNVDKETWFHVGSLYLVSLTHTHNLNRIAAPVARQLWISHVVRSD